MFDEGEEYRAFVDKFKPKKTTDDCYTPEVVYEAVAEWVEGEYGIERTRFVRPFWPGGDYERMAYPEGCMVVDNPPFSILSRIIKFYCARGVRFFLFAPTLTLFAAPGSGDVTYLPTGVQITYEKGAKVNTSFVTNMPDDRRIRCVPALYARVRKANEMNEKAMTKTLPKYSYPDHVLTAAAAYQFSHYGVPFEVRKSECTFIRALDAQRARDKSLFGGAWLLSERAAAERAAAERWHLSEREWAMVRRLSEGEN